MGSKISQLTEVTAPSSGNDQVEIIINTETTPVNRRIKFLNLLKRIFLGDGTQLTITTIADGEFLKRSGTNITSGVPSGTATGSPFELVIACSDETTALTTGTAKVTFRLPRGVTLTTVRASLTTAQSSGSIFTVDINEGGSTILSTKLTIDNGEKTSVSAATAPVISDSALADDAEITIDIDQVGDGTAKGLKVTLIGTRA